MREVLLTGSVPREPAAEVFRITEHYLRSVLRRVPDGEQKLWGGTFGDEEGDRVAGHPTPRGAKGVARASAIRSWQEEHPLLEPAGEAPMTRSSTPFAAMGPRAVWRLRTGTAASDFVVPQSRVSEIKIDSYRQFRQLKAEGTLPEHLRFQATLPGPATTTAGLSVPIDVGVAAAARMLAAEVDAIAAAIPGEDLAVQLDLAVELEMEELRRRPGAFDAPFFELMAEGWGEWKLERLAEIVAGIAERVPPDAELGFHLCGMWHLDPGGGQDMQVHVDWANHLAAGIGRRIDYIHMASVPEHDAEAYRPLRALQLGPETTLFLGLIHLSDGLDGAKRRIAAAAESRAEFGIAHFCGMAPLFQVRPEQLDDLLELHRQTAEL